MKAKMIQESVYTLEVGGVRFPGMRVKSRWLGFTQLVDEKEQMLIVRNEDGQDSEFATIFDGIFRDPAASKECGVTVMAGSPDLLSRIASAATVEKAVP